MTVGMKKNLKEMNDSAKPVDVDPELILHALQPQGYSHHNSSKTACARLNFEAY